MDKCLNCNKETNNPRFCSRSCSTIYNNKKNPKRKRKYSYEILRPIVKNSISIRDVVIKLGLSPTGGGNANHIKKIIKELNIDTSHFLGRKSNTGNFISPKEYLIVYPENSNIKSDNIKKRLIRDGIKDKKCEKCGRKTWNGKDITLELHHKDGIKRNNLLENLELLCPNCHSQTDSWRKRK